MFAYTNISTHYIALDVQSHSLSAILIVAIERNKSESRTPRTHTHTNRGNRKRFNGTRGRDSGNCHKWFYLVTQLSSPPTAHRLESPPQTCSQSEESCGS